MEGINGETCFLLIQDEFAKMVHNDVRMSKAPPIEFIDEFLQTHAPVECQNKFVTLDQGGELCGSPQIQKVFKKCGHAVHPVAPDASRQNSVERHHQTVTNAVRAVLIGANLPIKFWPCAVFHAVQVFNSLPSAGQSKSKLEPAAKSKEDWSKLEVWGCRVWVRSAGRRSAKFKSNAGKGIFPGHTPHTAGNFLWHDCGTDEVKIATHGRFDEGHSDLPLNELPPNVHFSSKTDDRESFRDTTVDVSASDLSFHVCPFASTFAGTIPLPCKTDNCGFTTVDDSLTKRACVTAIAPRSSAAKLNRNLEDALQKRRGAFITHVNGSPVCNTTQVKDAIAEALVKGGEIQLKFGLKAKLTSNRLRRTFDECNLLIPPSKASNPSEVQPKDESMVPDDDGGTRFPIGTKICKPFGKQECAGKITHCDAVHKLHKVVCTDGDEEELWHAEIQSHLKPSKSNKQTKKHQVNRIVAKLAPTELDEDVHSLSFDMDIIGAVASVRCGNAITHQDASDEEIKLWLNAVGSKSTTPEEQAIGRFTGRKPKKPANWDEWKAGEHKQLNQFHKQGMFGEPFNPKTLDPDAVIPHPQWAHAVKRSVQSEVTSVL